MRFISIFLPPLWLEWLEYFVSISFFQASFTTSKSKFLGSTLEKKARGSINFDLWISMYDPVFSKILFYCQEGNISPDETTELWRFRGVRGSTVTAPENGMISSKSLGGFHLQEGWVIAFSIWKLCSFCWNLELFKVWKFFTFHFYSWKFWNLFKTSFGILWIWKCSVVFAGGICRRNHLDFVFLMRARKCHTEEIGDCNDENLCDPILGGGFEYFIFTPIWGRFPISWLIFFR